MPRPCGSFGWWLARDTEKDALANSEDLPGHPKMLKRIPRQILKICLGILLLVVLGWMEVAWWGGFRCQDLVAVLGGG